MVAGACRRRRIALGAGRRAAESARPSLQEELVKTDMQLETDIREEFQWEPRVCEAEIGLAVKAGVVTLSGFVDSYAQKHAAEHAVARVGGARVVADQLKVKLPGSDARSDTEVGHQVANALKWDVEVPTDAVTARVENGWVFLDGIVEWQYQRVAVERAVRFLTGVQGVTNQTRIRPRVSTADVSQRIAAAFERTSADARRISVATRDGQVTLTGSVRSAAERQDVQRAAWGAPGVTSIDDRILVTA